MQFHIYHHYPDNEVLLQLARLNRTLEEFMSDIDVFVDKLLADVTAQKTQIDSLTALTAGIKNQLADALRGETLSPDAKNKLAAIFPALEANTAEISTAITANTDAAPVVTPASAPLDAPPSLNPAPGFAPMPPSTPPT